MYLKALASVVLGLASASAVSAQVTTFFGDNSSFPRDLTVPNQARDLFMASFATHKGTDDFEGYTPFTAPAVYNIASLGITYTSNMTFVNANQPPSFVLAVSGTQFTFGNGDPLPPPFGTGIIGLTNSFVFSQPVQGFGIYFVQVGDAVTNSFTLTLQDGPAGTPRVIPVNASGNLLDPPDTFGSTRAFDSTFFFGVVDSAFFDRVTITATSNQDGIVFDDLSVGFINAVPEPTTYALIGTVLAGVYGARQYQRRRAAKKSFARVR